jgi:arylsulfatase A-like enzyme
MSYFESSVRVPLLVYHPKDFFPHRVSQNVSTLDILPTMCDFVGTRPAPYLPMDGSSLLPHLRGAPGGSDTVIAEYTGEGTVSPLMMIRRGPWKFVTCPADGVQLYNLVADPDELINLAKGLKKKAVLSAETEGDGDAKKVLAAFEAEAAARWDFDSITRDVVISQRKRRLVWGALKMGQFTSWDYNPGEDGSKK